MYYCFLCEDLESSADHPFLLQKTYAARLNTLGMVHLQRRLVQDAQGLPLDLSGQAVFLRCTYGDLDAAMRFLGACGAILVETEENMRAIENWHRMDLTKRRIWEVRMEDLLAPDRLPKSMVEMICDSERVFLKSKRKGFCATLRATRLLQRHTLEEMWKTLPGIETSDLLITAYQPVRNDSLGKRETRHVVLHHSLINSSRPLHTLQHTVPPSHMRKAEEMVEKIRSIQGSPPNYVLDLGDFVQADGSVLVDVVELNPVTCAMCYLNNSIFETEVPEIRHLRGSGMGYEYCWDALLHPHTYEQIHAANRNYSYETDSIYDLE